MEMEMEMEMEHVLRLHIGAFHWKRQSEPPCGLQGRGRPAPPLLLKRTLGQQGQRNKKITSTLCRKCFLCDGRRPRK